MRTRVALAAVTALAVLLGCKTAEDAGSAKSAPIAITADQEGFKPSSITVKKGSEARLVFTRTTDDTCATAVVFPELNIRKDLPKGQPVEIVIPTDKERTLTFQCGMGMFKSTVVVSSK
ncbi:MAG: cupredoxin domain-containing protein [Polyangiaceae bacterium]|nr:cupredoxin domain-containing protein [Polyangiaceae bacterium]